MLPAVKLYQLGNSYYLNLTQSQIVTKPKRMQNANCEDALRVFLSMRDELSFSKRFEFVCVRHCVAVLPYFVFRLYHCASPEMSIRFCSLSAYTRVSILSLIKIIVFPSKIAENLYLAGTHTKKYLCVLFCPSLCACC